MFTKKMANKTSILHHKTVAQKLTESWQLYLFVLPTLIYFLIFNYFPMYGVQLAFKYFNPALGITGSSWVGMDNFMRFFNSFYFWRLLKNTLVLSIYSLIICFPFPIILALLINEIVHSRVKKVIQTTLYAPYFISTVVIVGIINVFFNTSTGFINIILAALGGETIPFLIEPKWFKHMYALSGLWQTAGWNSIIYIAALTSIDPSLHEAAQIDGANQFQRIVHINIPGIMPTAVILFIMQMGRVMNVGFEKAFLMQNAMNKEASEIISTFVYTQGLINMDYGYSTAVGLFNNIINIILLLLFNHMAKKFGSSGLF